MIHNIKIYFYYFFYFRIANRVISKSEELITLLNWDKDNVCLLLLFFLSKNIHRLKSILLLVKRGYTIDAMSLYRTLIEDTLQIEYLLKNDGKEERFFQYSIYKDIQMIERRKKVRELSKQETESLNKLKNEWEKVKSNFLDKNKRIKNTWLDVDLKKIANDAGFTYMITAYQECNDYVHSNSNLFSKFIVGKNKKGILLLTGGCFSKKLINNILPSTILLLLHSTMIINSKYKTNLTKTLISIRSHIDKMIRVNL